MQRGVKRDGAFIISSRHNYVTQDNLFQTISVSNELSSESFAVVDAAIPFRSNFLFDVCGNNA